jgi:hypothetical protein
VIVAYNYDSLRALAKKLGRRLDSLYALSHDNDPFVVDMPRRQEAAEWFADCWRRFAGSADDQSKPHIRRIHYRLVSQSTPIPRPNGEPYENTAACWSALCDAGRDARYLDLIPPESIIDRRNPEPMIYIAEPVPSEIEIVGGLGDIEVPTLTTPRLMLIAPTIRHRYLVEIWCEKSTVNDILMPLGEQYGVNIVTGTGELSATRVEQLIARIRNDGRPARILYISDFDPAGQGMPVSVARKLEFEIRKDGDELDVQVRHVALTYDQCNDYELPRTPIKETERRAEKWETRYGEGATELDALEALRPGELRRLLVREIMRYRDDSLERRMTAVAAELQSELDDISTTVRKRHAKALAKVEAERKQLAAAIRDFKRKAEPVLRAVDRDLADEAPDLEGYDWPEPLEGDEDDDPLYDSSRDYMDQLARYRAHQGKPEAAGFKLYDLTCDMCGEPFQSRRPRATTCRKQSCRNRKFRLRHGLLPKP